MAMYNLVRLGLAGAAFVWGSLALPAVAGGGPDGGVTAQEVAGVMRARKMAVAVTTDKDGDPLINSTVGSTKFKVYFYQCKGPRCGSIQFSAGFEGAENITVSKVMDWNRTKRFGRAYIDKGTLYVEMDMDVEHGTNTEALANNFARWGALVEQFPKFFK